jgi:hypothetical protein
VLEQDLAVDSLDLLDVAVRIEEEFDVVFPDREVPAIRTYGDLVDATTALVACRRRATQRDQERARVAVHIGEDSGEIPRFVRVLDAGPYDRELLADDLHRTRAPEVAGLSGVDGGAPGAFGRTIVRASLAGADLRVATAATASRSHVGPAEVPTWSVSRLVGRSLALVDQLAAERDVSARWVTPGSGSSTDSLVARRKVTDEHVLAFRATVETYLDVLTDSRPILYAAARELGRLDVVRCAIDVRTTSLREARDAYDSIADALLCYVYALQSLAAWRRARLPPRGVTATPRVVRATESWLPA